MKDPNISQFAKELGITPDWLKKKMKPLGITGYKDGQSVRLSSLDRAKLKLEFTRTDTQTNTRTDTRTDTQTTDFGYSGIAVQPIVEVVEYEAAPIPTFAPVTFHRADRSGAIAQLQQNCELLNERTTNHFSGFKQNLIANAAQQGLQDGMEAAQAYLAGLNHATQMVGKQGGSGA